MKVNIEDVRAALEERGRINRAVLDDIEWYEKGVRIEIPQEWIDEFELTGLCNIDFISSNFYLYGWGENQYRGPAATGPLPAHDDAGNERGE